MNKLEREIPIRCNDERRQDFIFNTKKFENGSQGVDMGLVVCFEVLIGRISSMWCQ
jgi:hypothetical protein